jgi:hypothetical protein
MTPRPPMKVQDALTKAENMIRSRKSKNLSNKNNEQMLIAGAIIKLIELQKAKKAKRAALEGLDDHGGKGLREDDDIRAVATAATATAAAATATSVSRVEIMVMGVGSVEEGQ